MTKRPNHIIACFYRVRHGDVPPVKDREAPSREQARQTAVTLLKGIMDDDNIAGPDKPHHADILEDGEIVLKLVLLPDPKGGHVVIEDT